jgi:hypothetical protein
MRKQNVGYAMIAKELKLSLGSVKQFCRRNGLQSGDLETDTQPENISETPPDVDLISDGTGDICETYGIYYDTRYFEKTYL